MANEKRKAVDDGQVLELKKGLAELNLLRNINKNFEKTILWYLWSPSNNHSFKFFNSHFSSSLRFFFSYPSNLSSPPKSLIYDSEMTISGNYFFISLYLSSALSSPIYPNTET